jgi:large subunit ribosomal protein L23
MDYTQVLIKPVVTEKTTIEETNGRYTFIVNSKATKIDIKNAVRQLYGVDVKQVTVRPTPQKIRLVGRGREIVKRQRVKKASVTLAKGERMDLYKFTKEKAKK